MDTLQFQWRRKTPGYCILSSAHFFYTCSLVDEILELVMTKGADGPQFHLLFFSA